MARILVVEDEPDIRTLLADVLRSEGYPVLTAGDGLQALEQLRTTGADLVILDLRMPGVDGWAVLRERNHEVSWRSVPVIVLSASRAEALREARQLGATACLAKPFDLDELLVLVRRTLAHALAGPTPPAAETLTA